MLSWITNSNLGTIKQGFISEARVDAVQTTYSTQELKYSLRSGSLPVGLSLLHDGTIAGRVSYSSTGTYTFSVNVIDNVNSESSSTSFSMEVLPSATAYTRAYFTPFFNLEKREEFRQFILNEDIFTPSLIYRYWDQNFGVQTKLKMVLEFGIEQTALQNYAYALRENFYRKRLYLGAPKIAIARDSSGVPVYEVIYLDVIDELENSQGISANQTVYSVTEEIYYPGSIDNMREQLRTIVLDDHTFISIDNNLQPKFMLTQEEGKFRTNTYMRVVPLCYAVPGKGNVILNKIKNSGFKFNRIDFEIDRLVISDPTDKYLIFERQAVGNLISTDRPIYGPERWVSIDTENDETLERE